MNGGVIKMDNDIAKGRDFAYPPADRRHEQAQVLGQPAIVVKRDNNEELFAGIGAKSHETDVLISPLALVEREDNEDLFTKIGAKPQEIALAVRAQLVARNSGSDDLQQAYEVEISSRPCDKNGEYPPESEWTSHGKLSPEYPLMAHCLHAGVKRRKAAISTLFQTDSTFEKAVAVFNFEKTDDAREPLRLFLRQNNIITRKNIRDFVQRETSKKQGGGVESLQEFYHALRSSEEPALADHVANICVNSENTTFTQKANFAASISEELSDRKAFGEIQHSAKTAQLKDFALSLAQDASVDESDRAAVYSKILALPEINLLLERSLLKSSKDRFVNLINYAKDADPKVQLAVYEAAAKYNARSKTKTAKAAKKDRKYKTIADAKCDAAEKSAAMSPAERGAFLKNFFLTLGRQTAAEEDAGAKEYGADIAAKHKMARKDVELSSAESADLFNNVSRLAGKLDLPSQEQQTRVENMMADFTRNDIRKIIDFVDKAASSTFTLAVYQTASRHDNMSLTDRIDLAENYFILAAALDLTTREQKKEQLKFVKNSLTGSSEIDIRIAIDHAEENASTDVEIAVYQAATQHDKISPADRITFAENYFVRAADFELTAEEQQTFVQTMIDGCNRDQISPTLHYAEQSENPMLKFAVYRAAALHKEMPCADGVRYAKEYFNLAAELDTPDSDQRSFARAMEAALRRRSEETPNEISAVSRSISELRAYVPAFEDEALEADSPPTSVVETLHNPLKRTAANSMQTSQRKKAKLNAKGASLGRGESQRAQSPKAGEQSPQSPQPSTPLMQATQMPSASLQPQRSTRSPSIVSSERTQMLLETAVEAKAQERPRSPQWKGRSD